MDTIVARSTAPGRAGVAVIRISGPASWGIVEALTRKAVPQARYMALRNIWENDDILDQALVVVFDADRSFTGEVSAELHVHGSEAVVRAVLNRVIGFEGVRVAEAGEFSRRALENEMLDLSAIEGLGALLQAETEAQRRQAMRLVTGDLRAKSEDWRRDLLHAVASLEVTVDFADEDVPVETEDGYINSLRSLSGQMRTEAEGWTSADKIARGFEVAIVGAVNSGKSTLLNRLAGREAALTSNIAGTTRDVVEVRIDIAGYLVTVLDTAGIRATDDHVEGLGVARALVRAEQADLRIFVDDVPEGIVFDDGDILVRGKCDIRGNGAGLPVSGLTGDGISDLLEAIGKELASRVDGAGLAISQRQAEKLAQAGKSLDDAADLLETEPERIEIASALIRSGISALEEVVGRVGVEDILGEIFSEFCIGK